MRIDLKRVGDLVTLEAEGSPEDLVTFCRLSGIDVERKAILVPGPKGDKGDTGPAGPMGPSGLPGVLSGQRGCVCPPSAEIRCASSACPRKGINWGGVTCGIATSPVASLSPGVPSYGAT